MKITKDIIINKSVKEVWEVLGNQFTEAHKWATGLYHSEGVGAPHLAGANCRSRACETSFGHIKEEIKIFNAQKYRLEYEVVEGFPNFVKNGKSRWYLSELNEHQTKVDMLFTAETSGLIGTIKGMIMEFQLNGRLNSILEEFKYYVEYDKPHPNKLKEMEKQAQKMRKQLA